MKYLPHQITSLTFRFYAHNLFRQLGFFSAVLVPFFTQWGGISLFQVQLLQSWFAFWLFLLEIPTGAVADYVGRKYSLALGAFMTVIGALIYGSVPSMAFFLLGEFLFALGVALTSGADQALLYDSLVEAGQENQSKQILARAHTSTLLGVMLSAVAGSFIAMKFGLNAPMLLSAIPFLLAALIAMTFSEPRSHQKVTESQRYTTIIKEGVTFFYHHRQLKKLALNAVIVAAGGYFSIWLYQVVLQKLDIPLYYFGLGHVLLTLSEIVVTSTFIRMEKWFGSARAYFQLTALLTALPFFLVALFPSLPTVIIFIVLSGGFGMTRIELMSSYLNKHISSNQRATVLSSVSMLRRFLLMGLNPLVGFLATGSLPVALIFVGTLPLAVFFLFPLKAEDYEATHPIVPSTLLAKK